MKKFGRKLVLSGLALAATAATLSTSTYAWYVTNTTAEVNQGTAGTAGTSASGNLLVSNDTAGAYGAFTNSINLPSVTDLVKPVTKNAGEYAPTADTEVDDTKTYYTLNNASYEEVGTPTDENIGTYYEKAAWIDVDGKAVADESAYVELSFWVLSTEQTTVNFTTNFTNSTSGTPITQVLYNANGKPTKIIAANGAPATATGEDELEALDTFTVDAGYALRFEVTTKAETGNATVLDTYGIENFTNNTYVGKEGYYSNGNAHTYFYNVAGKNPLGGTEEAGKGSAAFTSITVGQNVKTRVTIKIWIEGTDLDCFDSCVGQDFTFDFDLSV